MIQFARILRHILRYVGYAFILLVVVLLAAVSYVGFTDSGARLAAGMVEDLASTPDRRIAIADPSGLLTGHLRIGSVTVSDAAGAYAELRDLSVDWTPLDLLAFRFNAEHVAASSVSLLRLPSPAAQEETQSSKEPFSLPLEVAVDRLEIPEILIGEAVAGREQRLALAGGGSATRDSVALKLALNETERPDARLAADIVFNPPGNELRLEADIAEPPGGMLAQVLKLPGEPAVNIRLTGDGPLSQWVGKLSASLDGGEVLALDGRHELSGEGVHRVALSGGGSFDALMPPQLRPLFSGTTGIDVAAAFDGSDMIRIEKGDISTGALTLNASGTASASGANDLEVRLAGTNGPIDFRWPLAEGEARLLIEQANATLTGPADGAALDASASVLSATLPQAQVENVRLTAKSPAFNLATRSGKVDATIGTGNTAFASADVERLVKGPIKVSAALDVSPENVAFNPVTIESASIGGTLSGSYGLQSRQAEASFQLFALPAVLPEGLAAKFDTTIAMEGRLSAAGDGALDLRDFQLRSGTVEAAGSVALAGGNLDAALSGRVLELGKLLADATGQADFEMTAKGPLNGLGVRAEVTSSGATLAGRTLSDLVVTLDGQAVPGSPSGALTVTGALDGQAINIRSNVVSEAGRISIPTIEAEIGPNTLNGALTLAPDFMPDGTIRFNFPDLSLLAAMAGQKAAGDLAGNVVIDNSGGRTALTLQANGSGIRRDTLRIEKPSVDLRIADLKTAAITGSVRTESLVAGANRLEGLNLAFNREGAVTNVDLGGRYDGAPLVARARIEQQGSRINVGLDRFEAAPRRIAVRLANPTRIGVDGGTVTLDGLTIAAGSGNIAVSGTAGEALDLSARLNALPASLVNAFAAGLGAEGTIGGTVTVKGSASAPVVGYALDWQGAAISQTRSAGVGAFAINAKGEFANNTVRLDTTLSGGGGMSFRGSGTVGITGNMPLSIKVDGTLPFSLLAAQLAEQGFTLSGNAAVDLSISGAARSPVISGTVSTSGAQLIDVRRNLAINGLAARVSLNGQQATIEQLTGTLASGGRISGSGTVGIAPGSGYPANLTINLGNITYVDGTLFNANVAGDLTLTGPLLSAPVLGGTVRISKAAITIPEKLPASLSEIDIKHKNAPRDVVVMNNEIHRENTGGSGEGRGIGLDLVVDAPGQIFVRGRGIDAELGGRLTIRGTSPNPDISGGFEMRRGRLEILAKRLDFTDGNIGFAGGLVPTLDLKATSTAGSTTITVTVAGLASNPTVSFSSSPALPQDEILAQLIFNRSMSNLSALQIAQLAAAVNQLAGGRSGGLLEGLRSRLGVDDLDISTDAEGRAQVSAGKYLNDRTYLELKQDAESGGGKAVINLDVGRGVKLRGEAGSSGGAAGIFYEREY
ncbi:MAG: translocation/assembly module TamB domain-containing protein [Shinella sp.]|nr:translocation/assembly module TamB domain-containing protein [Shinella sp.]